MSQISTTAETVRFPVAGMTCGSCVNPISRAIRQLDGVTRVSVDLRTETAETPATIIYGCHVPGHYGAGMLGSLIIAGS